LCVKAYDGSKYSVEVSRNVLIRNQKETINTDTFPCLILAIGILIALAVAWFLRSRRGMKDQRGKQ
jgi:hypothetical protein